MPELSKKRMAPAVTTAELNGSTTVLLAALKRCYEHLSKENLVQAIAKLKWAQQYGPHGDRTDPFEPDGEPLRFSSTRDHWLWALGFNNAGVGNYKAFQEMGFIEKTAKHDPSRNEYQRKYQKKRYHGRKKQAIKMLGGKCTVCGTTRGLELDHKNPDTKKFNVTKLWSVPEEEFKREVRKCKLLCKKHHRERTSKQRENGDVKSIPGKTQYDSKGRKTKNRKKKTASHGRRPSKKETLELGEKLGVDWVKVDINQLSDGIYVEQEHTGDMLTAAKIALDHLKERRDYYVRLKRVEGKSAAYYFRLATRVAEVLHDYDERPQEAQRADPKE